MKIETIVKLTNTKDKTELYSLFCHAAQGDFIVTTSKSGNSSDMTNLEATVDKAFDQFAQKMFEEGRKYERALAK